VGFPQKLFRQVPGPNQFQHSNEFQDLNQSQPPKKSQSRPLTQQTKWINAVLGIALVERARKRAEFLADICHFRPLHYPHFVGDAPAPSTVLV
jgi:hypothetical protein